MKHLGNYVKNHQKNNAGINLLPIDDEQDLQVSYRVGVKNSICHSKKAKNTVPIWYHLPIFGQKERLAEAIFTSLKLLILLSTRGGSSLGTSCASPFGLRFAQCKIAILRFCEPARARMPKGF